MSHVHSPVECFLHRLLRMGLALDQPSRCRFFRESMNQRIYRVFATVAYRLLTLHGWYRGMIPQARPKLTEPPEPPPAPVVIYASRAEAESIARLLGEDHVVVGVIPTKARNEA